MKNVAIVGAGLTGLVAGYRLSQKGYKVTIYEKSGETGGLMGGFKVESNSTTFHLEKTYHHIFKTDKYIVDLINELKLGDKLKWYPEKTALYYEGQMFPFMGAMDLLKFKPLDIVSKIRLGLVKIWLQFDNDWKKYENELAYVWMKKWCGQRAYRVIWEPLLQGKFGDKYKEISMAWLWARIHTRGNSGELGYLDGGFQQITEELVKRILQNKGKILLNYELNPSKSPFDKGDFNKGDFDKIIYTGPIKGIDYIGAIDVVFTSKQSLSPYYWHNINDLKSPFLAMIQHTNMVDKKNYDNRHVYYLGTYIPHNHRYFKVDEESIKKEFFEYLKKIFPKFNKKDVEQSWVFRLKNAQHVVIRNFKPTPYPSLEKGGLYNANFAQIYPEDRGINYAVREGEKAAKAF